METRLAIASKRDVRDYAARPLPEGAERRILDAGRVAGSASNRQAWEFVVVEAPESRQRLARALYSPRLALTAGLVVAIVMDHSNTRLALLDAGRAAQNMMLAAWDEGIGSCPCGIQDPEAADRLLGAGGERRTAIVLAFGVPARPARPERRTPEEWIARARRKPFEQVVRRI